MNKYSYVYTTSIFHTAEAVNIKIKKVYKRKVFLIRILWYCIKNENFGGTKMNSYGEGYGERPRETVYHAGNGFYSPYIEPEWKKEKRLLRGAGNGIALAALGYVAISFAASFVFMLMMELVYPVTNLTGKLFISEAAEWTFNLAMYIVSLVIPFAIYTLAIRMPLKVALPLRRAKIGLTAGGVLVGLGACVAASYATSALQVTLEVFGIGITMPEFTVPETVPGIILYFITMALAPAFIEEMVFRGVIMQSLRRFGDIFALVASSLIFGIFHLNLIQMPYAFIVGLCIGYFVMRTGSLWVGVIIHFINNTVSATMELIIPKISEEMLVFINVVYNFVCVILAVIAIIALLAKYKDMFRFGKAPGVLSPGRKSLYFMTSPVLIIAMIGAVIMTLQYIYII